MSTYDSASNKASGNADSLRPDMRTHRGQNEAILEHLLQAVERGTVPPSLQAARASLLEKLKQEQTDYRARFTEDETILKMPSMGVLEIVHEMADQPRSLFATDIKTPALVRLRLYRAHVRKATGEVERDELLSEVVMSESQLGTVLVNSNRGEGYPVTIEALQGKPVPTYDPALDPTKKRLAMMAEKISAPCPQVSRFVEEIDQLLCGAEDKGRMNKSTGDEIAKLLSYLAGHAVSNSVHDLSVLSEELQKRINEASLDLHLTTNQLALERKE